MKLPSWHECLENAREASLELSASLLDVCASRRARVSSDCDDQTGCERPHRPCTAGSERHDGAARHHRGGGDFLSDWLRLNVNYASQVALLGSGYAGVVSRGLGRLCARGAPPRATSARSELDFQARARGTAVARLSVRNQLFNPATLTVECLVGGSVTLLFREAGRPGTQYPCLVTLHDQNGDAFERARLAPDETLTLSVSLNFGQLQAGKRYHSELPVKLGGRSKDVHLFAEVFR
jgi:hypothetical protein